MTKSKKVRIVGMFAAIAIIAGTAFAASPASSLYLPFVVPTSTPEVMENEPALLRYHRLLGAAGECHSSVHTAAGEDRLDPERTAGRVRPVVIGRRGVATRDRVRTRR